MPIYGWFSSEPASPFHWLFSDKLETEAPLIRGFDLGFTSLSPGSSAAFCVSTPSTPVVYSRVRTHAYFLCEFSLGFPVAELLLCRSLRCLLSVDVPRYVATPRVMGSEYALIYRKVPWPNPLVGRPKDCAGFYFNRKSKSMGIVVPHLMASIVPRSGTTQRTAPTRPSVLITLGPIAERREDAA